MENKQVKNHQIKRSAFDRFSLWIFSKLKGGFFGHFFTSYDASNSKHAAIVKKRKKASYQKRKRRIIARSFEKNPIINAIPKLQELLLRASLRDYGVVLFTIGIISCAFYFATPYVSVIHATIQDLIVGIIVAICSLPMLFSSKSLSSTILDGKLSYGLIIGFLGFSEENYRIASNKKAVSSPSISLLVGMIFSVLSYFVGPIMTIVIVLLTYVAYETLLTPESGIVFIILSLPFTTSKAMACVVLYVTFCYVIKCLIGKRTFKFELMDRWFSILIPIVIYGVIISVDISSSVHEGVLSLILLSSFFVA